MESATIYASLFFALAIAWYQALHCYYVSKDPGYKGKLGLGWPWFHRGVVNLNEPCPWWRNYAHQSTLTLLACSFLVSLVALEPVFSSEELSSSDFVLAMLALVAIGAFSQIMGPGAYKGFLTLLLVTQIGVLCYMASEDRESWVLTTYASIVVSLTFSIGFGWMRIMLSKFTKAQRRQSLYVMGLYAIGSLFVTWIGWAAVLIPIGW